MGLSRSYIYDETSPTCLRWNRDVYSGRWMNQLNVSVGSVAGGLGNSGYYQVRVEGVLTLAHRIVWELCVGGIPEGMFIDHMNGVKTDNKLSNLRVVDRKYNARNVKLRSDSTSGTTGVTRFVNTDRNGSKRSYWRATWSDALTGKVNKKAFSVSRYGDELAEFMAKECRNHQISLLNLSGAGYTERHGK